MSFGKVASRGTQIYHINLNKYVGTSSYKFIFIRKVCFFLEKKLIKLYKFVSHGEQLYFQ